MSRKTPLLSPRIAASTRAVESGSVSLNSPEDCMSVEPVRFHDIVLLLSGWLFRAIKLGREKGVPRPRSAGHKCLTATVGGRSP